MNRFIPLVATPLVGGVPRTGEWTKAEIEYVLHMSTAFKEGLFDEGIPEGARGRLWFATLLNCRPMRLSKKFSHTSKVLGVYVFKKNVDKLEAMSTDERLERFNAMEAYREQFLESIGQDSRSTIPSYWQRLLKVVTRWFKNALAALRTI